MRIFQNTLILFYLFTIAFGMYFPQCDQLQPVQTLSVPFSGSARLATHWESGNVYLLSSQSFQQVDVEDAVGNMKLGNSYNLLGDGFSIQAGTVDGNYLFLLREPWSGVNVFNFVKFDLTTWTVVGNITNDIKELESVDNWDNAYLKSDGKGEYLYALIQIDESGDDSTLIMKISQQTLKVETQTVNSPHEARHLVVRESYGYYHSVFDMYQFSLDTLLKTAEFSTVQQIGNFVVVDDSDCFVGAATELDSLTHNDPTEYITDTSIDMTSDTRWQPPSEADVDETTGTTYWLTITLNGIDYDTYLYRVSTSPFEVLSVTNLPGLVNNFNYYSDPIISMNYDDVVTKSIYILTYQSSGYFLYKYAGAGCHSSIPMWLRILVVLAAVTVGLILLAFISKGVQNLVIYVQGRRGSSKLANESKYSTSSDDETQSLLAKNKTKSKSKEDIESKVQTDIQAEDVIIPLTTEIQ